MALRAPDGSYPVLFVGLVTLGVILRILLLRSYWSWPDADEATGMMMAFRASHGHFAVFFSGTNYGGAIITWIEAPLVRIFGLHIWVFHAVDTIVSIVDVVLLRSIARRLIQPFAADLAAATYVWFPLNWMFWSSKEYVFWLPAITFALATVLCVLRWIDVGDRRALWAIGLFSGLTYWSYPLAAPLVLPALLGWAWHSRRNLRDFGRGVALLPLGALPWIIENIVHPGLSFHGEKTTDSHWKVMKHAIKLAFPSAFLNGEKPSGLVWTGAVHFGPQAEDLGWAAFAFVVAYILYETFRRRPRTALVGLSIIAWPLILSVGRAPVDLTSYRYALIAVPPVLVIAADVLGKIRLAPVMAVGTLLAVGATTHSETNGFAATPSCDPGIHAVGTALVAQHRTNVWAAYWASTPLEVCSAGRVTAAAIMPDRDAIANRAARNAPQSTYVAYLGNNLDLQLRSWSDHHPGHATRQVVSYFVIWRFNSNISPTTLGLAGLF